MKNKNNISQISRKVSPHPRPPTSLEAYLCLALVGGSILLTSLLGGPIQFGIHNIRAWAAAHCTA